MMLTEDELLELHRHGEPSPIQARELICVYRLWLAAEADGRVLPKLPDGWVIGSLFGGRDAFHDGKGKRSGGYVCELFNPTTREFLTNNYGVVKEGSDDAMFGEYQFQGPTPAAAVSTAIAQIKVEG